MCALWLFSQGFVQKINVWFFSRWSKKKSQSDLTSTTMHILSVLSSQILFLDKWFGTVVVYITRSGAVTAHWAAGSNLFGCVSVVLACVLGLAWMYQKERGGKGREELVPTREALWHVSSSFVRKLQCCFPFFTKPIWFEIQVLVQKRSQWISEKTNPRIICFFHMSTIFLFFGLAVSPSGSKRNLGNVWTGAFHQFANIFQPNLPWWIEERRMTLWESLWLYIRLCAQQLKAYTTLALYHAP